MLRILLDIAEVLLGFVAVGSRPYHHFDYHWAVRAGI